MAEADAAVSVDIDIRTEAWREVADLELLTRAAIGTACARADPALAGEVSVVFADDDFQRDLNRRFRGRDAPTNVLSFGGAPPLLGDIVLARETVFREAKSQGKRTSDHILHLLVHGMLHLLGYDHLNDSDQDTMETLEVAVLAELGVADPYVAVDERC